MMILRKTTQFNKNGYYKDHIDRPLTPWGHLQT